MGDARFNRAADDALDENEKKSPAIKRGDGDEINECKIDGDNRHNGEEISEPLRRCGADDAGDADRARDLR